LPPPRVFDTLQQVVLLDDELRAAFEIDTVPLAPEPRRWKPWRLPDGTSCEVPELWLPVEDGPYWVVRDAAGNVVARMPKDGFYFEPVFAPLRDVSSPAELSAFDRAITSFDWPSWADEAPEAFEARARRLHEETDYAVVLNLCMHFLAAGQILRGFENFMVDLLADKPLAEALLERLCEAYIERARRVLARVGRFVDVVLLNDDLGTQNGPMIAVECYRELIWPRVKRLIAAIRKGTGAPVLMHSCGAVRDFIPLLIDAGVDALNPVQVSAAGMDPAGLKRDFGRDITFWGGGCDTQHVLPRGTPEEVAAEVRRRVAAFAPGGGFVFTQVHNIQPDVPPANVVAMIEALRKGKGDSPL
jgi:uroporphyrinogen decarboxylase